MPRKYSENINYRNSNEDCSFEEDFEDFDNTFNSKFKKYYIKKKKEEADLEDEPKEPEQQIKSEEKIDQTYQLSLVKIINPVRPRKMSSSSIKRKRNFKNIVITKLPPDEKEIHSGDKVKKIQDKKNKSEALKNHPFRQLVFSPKISMKLFLKFIFKIYTGLSYAENCVKSPSKQFLDSKKISLGEKKDQNKKTLFLDLDETLVHTCDGGKNYQHLLKYVDDEGKNSEIRLNVRPFCKEFLSELSRLYEIFIFTASSGDYCKTIIDFIDPKHNYITGFLEREKCLQTKNGFFIKDLRIINDRDIKDIIIVDNLSHSFGFQIENGIPILEWKFHKKDQELLYLKDYLIEAYQSTDFRDFNKEKLRLREILKLSEEEIKIL